METLYLLGEQDRIVGVSGYAVRPARVRRKSRGSRLSPPPIFRNPGARARPRPLLFGPASQDRRRIVAAGVAVHVFNQRDIAGILAMIRTLGALVDAADKRGDQLAESYAAS